MRVHVCVHARACVNEGERTTMIKYLESEELEDCSRYSLPHPVSGHLAVVKKKGVFVGGVDGGGRKKEEENVEIKQLLFR